MIAILMRSALLPALLIGALSACSQRQESTEAAMALAEAIWPGQLELYDTRNRVLHHDVTLAVRGDPVTRITFRMEMDPAECTLGSPCEERLRWAYDNGLERSRTLAALERAFAGCGFPVLAQTHHSLNAHPPRITPVIELDLDIQDQQPALDRLAPCLDAFWREAPTPEQDALEIRIVRQDPTSPSAPPDMLTFETDISDRLKARQAYSVTTARGASPQASDLSFAPYPRLKRALDEEFAEGARKFLRAQGGGHVPQTSLVQDLRLDPQRADMVRGYLFACTTRRLGQDQCDENITISLTHNMSDGGFSDIVVSPIARDRDGVPQNRPDISGR